MVYLMVKHCSMVCNYRKLLLTMFDSAFLGIYWTLMLHYCFLVRNLYLYFLSYRKRNRDLTYVLSFQTFHMNVLIFIWAKWHKNDEGCVSFLPVREESTFPTLILLTPTPTAGKVLSERFERFNPLVSIRFPPDVTSSLWPLVLPVFPSLCLFLFLTEVQQDYGNDYWGAFSNHPPLLLLLCSPPSIPCK